jgi:hypothetical protein
LDKIDVFVNLLYQPDVSISSSSSTITSLVLLIKKRDLTVVRRAFAIGDDARAYVIDMKKNHDKKGKEYYPSFTCYESALVCYGADGPVETNMGKQTVVMHSIDCLSEAKFNLEEYGLTILEDCAIILLNIEQRLDPLSHTLRSYPSNPEPRQQGESSKKKR